MPTYDYICDSCNHEFEKMQSITADPIKECPECGQNSAVRVISGGAGVIFKGSGFYSTDYRDSSYQKDKKADVPASVPACASGGGCNGGGCGA